MDKTLVLTENHGTSIYEGKNLVDYQKLRNIDLQSKKKYGNIPKKLKFFNKFIALEHWFTFEKLCNYGKNYDTMEKLWYYENISDILPKTMELWLTMAKNNGSMEKLWYYS